MLAGLTAWMLATVLAIAGAEGWHACLFMAMGIIGALFAERSCAGVVVWRQTRDRTALAFGLSHLVRDAAWSIAIVLWIARGLLRRERAPAHSMLPHAQLWPARGQAVGDGNLRLLAVVPAYNERANLSRVVADLSRILPRRDILIVNDGSTDGTADLLPSLGV